MPTLHVDFREGFNRETVVVRIDGSEIYRRNDVATNYAIGLADRLVTEVPEGEVAVEVILPNRALHQSTIHHVSGPTTLAFTLSPSGELEGQEVEASPRYL